MKQEKTLNYKGEDLRKEKKSFTHKGEPKQIDVYLPSDELIKAVHLAFQVNRPLLIMGEPGCGKTRLAEAVAYELHKEKMYDHFFTWHIKSTTRAEDGIYQIDTLRRMYDANVKEDTKGSLKSIEEYINYGKLADAFQTQPNNDQPNILLIDEIDKADIDFPNDLLLELDKKEFEVKELKETIKATGNILIFITSNEEKELPPAFLRRCLFHFIDFPNKKQLKNIVLSHYGELDKYEYFEKALTLFIELNREIEGKKPSTSEMIDWFKMINYYNSIRNNEGLTDLQKLLIKELEKFEETKDGSSIPYSQILLKTEESRNKYKEDEKSK